MTTAARKACRHPGCARVGSDKRRGLCRPCFEDKAVRALYPAPPRVRTPPPVRKPDPPVPRCGRCRAKRPADARDWQDEPVLCGYCKRFGLPPKHIPSYSGGYDLPRCVAMGRGA